MNAQSGHGYIIPSSSSFPDHRLLDNASTNMSDCEAYQTEMANTTQRHGATSACVLFWIGFVAPWCWLIGGWLPALSREKISKGKGLLLPTWRMRPEKDKAVVPLHHRFVGPSLDSLTKLESSVSVEKMSLPSMPYVDPWIHRCRVAAMMSGLLLMVALILCFVVIGRAW
jgi:hypothetical protein